MVGMLRKVAILIVTLGLMAAGCATGPAQPGAAELATMQNAAPLPEVYRLGSGDRIRLIVFGEETLSGEFQVDGSGQLAMPLIGTILAEGRSPRELEEIVTASLKDRFLVNPRVSIEVLTFRPFFILGEVNAPGEYPYSSGLTVLNAVATAQGFTVRANTRVAMIRRAGALVEERVAITPSMPVQPGDTIRIIERIF